MRKDDLIIVVDMQNVYCKGEPWACLDTEGAAESILKILDKASPEQVILTEFLAPEDPVGDWKVYNETFRDINENEYMNELVAQLKERAAAYKVFGKSTFSSLKVPEIQALARKAGRVVVTGVVAECCVLATAFDAVDLGCHVVYLTDAVSGFDHEKERGAMLAMQGLAPVQSTIMTTQEYLDEE